MLKLLRFLLPLALVALATPCFAQGAVLQCGPVVVGHLVVWFGNGCTGDAGPASGLTGLGVLEELGITRGTTGSGPLGAHDCWYDQPPSTGAWHYLCFDPNANGGGLIDYGYGGTASPLALTLCVNNTCQPLPQATGSAAALPNRSPQSCTDTVTTADGVAGWNTCSGQAKTQNLYVCNSAVNGLHPIIKDLTGVASASFPITITPAVGDTIDYGSNFFISTPKGGVEVDCFGNHNWAVIRTF